MNHGVQGFMDDMTRHGFEPTAEAGLVVYRITPIDGVHSGTAVETGVSTDELTPWPQVPPHWIHLPGDVRLLRDQQSGIVETRVAEAQPSD